MSRQVPRFTDIASDVNEHPLLDIWRARLARRGLPPRVILPEGDDPRVEHAAARLVEVGVRPVLVTQDTRGEPPPGIEVTTVGQLAHGPAGKRVRELGHGRGWAAELVDQRLGDPLYLGAAAVATGLADGCVAGSRHPSGAVIRAGIQVIGLRPPGDLLSSSILLMLPDSRLMAFADCAVVPEPDEDQLAAIALATARTFGTLTGEEPLVAMLSFSTMGSAEHETVHRVRRATELVRSRAPGLFVDGELQFDAAWDASVAAHKAPGSSVAGQANVFVFPNLSAANIGYKIAQRLGGARAFGPVLQGLAAPMNDLSRGCSVDDVVNVALVSVLQAWSAPREDGTAGQG